MCAREKVNEGSEVNCMNGVGFAVLIGLLSLLSLFLIQKILDNPNS
jgi:hypothetical protein